MGVAITPSPMVALIKVRPIPITKAAITAIRRQTTDTVITNADLNDVSLSVNPKSEDLSMINKKLSFLVASVLWLSLVVTGSAFSAATCTGADPCHACKNCKYCKHCAKEGGKCGVCKK